MRGGGLVGGRVSPPYTDDFEFLFFFFFFFFGGGGGQRNQYVITFYVFSPAHLTVNHGISRSSANLISIDTGSNFLSRHNA